MSGVACGQVFTDDELGRLDSWYMELFSVFGHGDDPAAEDIALADKVQGYRDGTACKVPA